MNCKNKSIFDADTYYVAQAMKGGGGFLTALADALMRADSENRMKILGNWYDRITWEWERYNANSKLETK